MRVADSERQRVCEAIARVEGETSAEFVCVLARRSSRYEFYALAWAAVLALATPWLLLVRVSWSVADILVAQLVVFCLALLVLASPALRRWIVPRSVQRAAAHRAAAEQFFIRGLANTPHRRGILLFVSHDEHYARVLADDGAAGVVSDAEWRRAVDLLVDGARRGRHTDGFVDALDHCRTVLATAFPPDVPRANALADKFYVLD